MAQLLMPGSVVAMTDQAADRLLKLDSGDAALLYLHLLRWGTPDGLRWPEDRKQRALDQLKEHGLAAADFARTVEIGNIGAIKTLLKSGYGVSFLYRAAIRPEEAAGALGVIELSDFELRHDIMFLFPKNSNFRADYTTIFRELRACAEETGGA